MANEDLYVFFWRYPHDSCALYDYSGNRYFTGGSERIERMLVAKKWMEMRNK